MHNQYEVFIHVVYDRARPPSAKIDLSKERLDEQIFRPQSVKEISKDLILQAYQQAKVYKTDNILILWGDELAHQNAEQSYRLFDLVKRQIDMYQRAASSTDSEFPLFKNVEYEFEMSSAQGFFD